MAKELGLIVAVSICSIAQSSLAQIDPWLWPPSTPDTPYMAFCRANGVPIPPDWAETGTEWQFQGKLQTNLLDPGNDAFVWTYSDPTVRGACIALPRNAGGPGSLAGIICQSATTGAACFWDNMPKNNQTTPGLLGWKGRALPISELADGWNLSGVTGKCPECHSGNNVFLMAPDDPVWAKVLRGPLVTDPGSTFTTQVESSSDNQGGHPRYVPLTQSGPGWSNVYRTGPCSSCHEQPAVRSPVMPPVCAEQGVDHCYGQPAWLIPALLAVLF